ncbi:hypothetical protein [Dubosiella newyorkensis]|uniref:Uncharacterized protein n=1 Tax=Dubosiella newyorkensis TaxID=1862672 RepID=A0A1U7NNY8_9FIRM|nr:hypothetical protein [Dubosiella newyorkensis]OLU47195.1 hypothetical protein BO225_03500 [Dubosiella newyorkensis]
MSSPAQIRASNKYNKTHTILKGIRFNKNTEKEMIEWLENRQFSPYVKQLIQADMEAHKKQNQDYKESRE